MSETLAMVIIIAFFVVAFIVRHVLVNKGADAIDNAIKRKKNRESGDTTENLSDRYK